MTLLSISVLILTCLAAKAFSEILHCYECDDCKTSNKTLLQPCPQTMSTITPDNLNQDTTAIPSTTILTTTESTDTTESLSTLEALPSTTGTEMNDDDTEKVRKRSVRQISYRALMIRRSAREVEISHHCYSIKGYGGDQKKIKKGCIQVTGNKHACDVLKEKYSVPAENCEVCNQNKCNNSAVRNMYSISYLGFLLLIGFLMKNEEVFKN